MNLSYLLAQTSEIVYPRERIWFPYIITFGGLILGIAFYSLLALCIYWVAKYFRNAGKEQKLLRMEMGKLAEEVHILRQKFENENKERGEK
jgi:hypothetical protein